MPPSDHMIELIPGEHYVFIAETAAADLPGDAAVEDLASLALRLRAQSTLGSEVLLGAVAVANGVLAVLGAGGAIADKFTSAGRWLRKVRAGKRDDAIPPAPAKEIAERVLVCTPGVAAGGVPAAVASASVARVADGGSYVSLEVGRHNATVYISPDGSLSEVILREVAGTVPTEPR